MSLLCSKKGMGIGDIVYDDMDNDNFEVVTFLISSNGCVDFRRRRLKNVQ